MACFLPSNKRDCCPDEKLNYPRSAQRGVAVFAAIALFSLSGALPAAAAAEPWQSDEAAQSGADPQMLPPGVKVLLSSALEAGDEAAADAIAEHILRTFPGSASEVEALRAEFPRQDHVRQAKRAEGKQSEPAEPSLVPNWGGHLEFGASRSTGTLDSFGLYGAVEASQKREKWEHAFSARADIQRAESVQSVERYFAAWRPRYNLSPDFYLHGLAQFERDPSLSLASRYTGSGGIGYSIVDGDTMSLKLTGGPAVRLTRTMEGEMNTAVGGRAALDFDWKATPALQLKQDSSFIADNGNQSGRMVTGIESKLFGPVRARLSYEVRYEHNSLRETRSLATNARTTIIIGL